MRGVARRPRGIAPTALWVLAAVSLVLAPAWPQQSWPAHPRTNWQQEVREKVAAHDLGSALALVDRRLSEAAGDLEAHGWRGRLLAWQGNWAEAEGEYRDVLERAPNDLDILGGLADVLLWQGKVEEALHAADRARKLSPTEPGILLRRARILRAAGHTAEACRQYREILAFDARNTEAKSGLAGLTPEARHELRAGAEVSTFNYAAAATAQSLLLSSRWTSRWSTVLGADFDQRFGQDAGKFTAGTSLRFTQHDWLSLGGAWAHDNRVIPRSEAFVEYGRGLRLGSGWIQGLEISYRQRWLWYQDAHVLTLGVTQLYYLPKQWRWSLTLTGARGALTGAGIAWLPSGATRLEFPLHRGLAGNLMFANGTENFAEADQIGRFSARTFAGGMKYAIAARHEISGSVAAQNRSQGQTQNSFGVSYVFRF